MYLKGEINLVITKVDVHKVEKEDSRLHLKKILSSPKQIKGYSTKNSKPDYVFIPNEKISLTDEVKNYLSKYENEIKSQASPKTLYERIQNNKNWFVIHTVNSSGILFSYFVRNDMKFVYNENLTRVNFVKDESGNELGLILFTGKVVLNVKIMSTDGTRIYEEVKIWVY